ncbi:MAG: DUF5317 domain-containing protein [Dehalococcoidia bacterium]
MPVICLALQAAIIAGPGPLGDAEALRRVLFPASYVGLLAFVWLNRWSLAILVIGVGLALNLLVIAANGGLMPVSPETLVRAGLLERAASVSLGDPLPRSKDVVLTREDTRLWPLSDVFAVDNPLGVRAFSPGDLVIAFGLLVGVGEGLLLLARRRR